MSVFTTSTKRKVIGLIMALATVTALSATIVFVFAGQINHAMSTASMFINLIIITFATASRMNRKDARAKAEARRRAYWNDVAA